MRSTVRRLVALVGATSAATLALSGCSGGLVPMQACPAIGWINHVSVTLDSDATAVTSLEVCDGETCVTGPRDNAAGSSGLWHYVDRDGDTWSFALGMATPDPVTVRALASDGAVLAEATVSPEWERVGGSEQCGGPHEGTIELTT